MCRASCAKVTVSVCSVFAALAGLAVISFCFKLILGVDSIIGENDITVLSNTQGKETEDFVPIGVSPATDARREDGGINEINKRIAVIAFSVGISAVVYGLAGICTARVQRCPCTFVFGLISVALTAVYSLAAFALLSLYYVSDQEIKDFCEDNLNLDNTSSILRNMIREIEDYVYTVDRELKYAVNTHMCTDFCPCEGGWEYSIYGTATGLTFADHENNGYNFDGTFSVFTDCYSARRTLWQQQDPDHVEVYATALSLVRTLEQDYNCSGLCSPADFWASKDIKIGPPQQSCIYSMKDSFDENIVLLGWSIVATAGFSFLVFLCHCGLYFNRTPKPVSTVSKKRFIFD